MDADSPLAQVSTAADESTLHLFEFTGDGAEYFRIWLVNVLLTVATLGIYSAWAKVRNFRYFHGNTQVAGCAFDYHARPVAILKGRAIGVSIVVVYAVVVSLAPEMEPVFALVLVGAVPWIIVRALRFRYANTSHRAVRFGFAGVYAGIFKAFIAWPLGMILTLGLIWPYVRFRQQRYVVEHTRYGQTRFSFDGTPGPWFAATLITVLIFAAGVALAAAAFAPAMTSGDGGLVPSHVLSALGGLFAFILTTLFAIDYFRARTRNLLFNHAALDGHRFVSSMTPTGLFKVALQNALLVLVTLGFATPWAAVRLARYHADTLKLRALGGLGEFVAAQEAAGGAFGDEFDDLIDLDIGA